MTGRSPAGAGDLAAWIGRTHESRDVIATRPAIALAATLDHPESFAPGAALPPAWHWMYFHEPVPMSALGRDGHPALGGFLPPVALPRRMWAGGRLAIAKPLSFGETVTRLSTVRAIEQKQGRSGSLVFVTVEHRFSGDNGGDMTEEHDIVYRDVAPPGTKTAAASPAASAGAGTPPPSPDGHGPADWLQIVTPSSVMLFRYSALTFNGHRIHYDLDFCRKDEGYPGLVVHGPLIATLLLDLPRRHLPGRRVARFSFRALAPLFHDRPFEIAGHAVDGKSLSLTALLPGGGIAMQAEVGLAP